MVLDDVQLKFSDFLCSQASRASANFTFFSVSLKNSGGFFPWETICLFRQVSTSLIVFELDLPFTKKV